MKNQITNIQTNTNKRLRFIWEPTYRCGDCSGLYSKQPKRIIERARCQCNPVNIAKLITC